MTRETRFNLIFLAILLALLTPGGIILFRKKLQPTLKPMAMPHAVQRAHAYLSPLETPPGLTRVEPPQTARWIEGIVRERIGDGGGGRAILRPTDRDGLPLTSDKKTFQIVAAEPQERQVRIWLIHWGAKPVKDERWSVTMAGAEQPFEIVDSRTMAMPQLVREELGETGLLRPPHAIVWQELVVPKAFEGPIRLQRGSQDSLHFVPSFTNPGATRH